MDIISELIASVEKVNNKQKNVLFKKIVDRFGTDLSGMKFNYLGAYI